MCGIAGLFHLDPQHKAGEEALRRMTGVLAHRGPDGDGFYIDGPAALGHRRLSVIDLATGDQPMASADGALVIVFNGEIYNYLELREELVGLGHAFRTTSDTEVILAAYHQWGANCQVRLNGMWAFALLDRRDGTLLVSRDRLGEKPLFHAQVGDCLVFASEIKSILRYAPFARSTEVLHLYLALGYVPAPYTFYEGIRKLQPGTCLVARAGRVALRPYWKLPDIGDADMVDDEPRVLDRFAELFEDSVRIRMRSDVPFGAFLSGGLDSSSVVVAMSKQSREPIETFTIGFDEVAFDERAQARIVARRFHTHHHEDVAGHASFDASLTAVLHAFDEPFGDASAIPVGMVSNLARRHVTVALTGDGGDEVLSGYTSYRSEKFATQYQKLPMAARRALHAAARAALPRARGRVRYRLNRLVRLLELSDAPFRERFASKLSLLDRQSIARLIPPGTVCIDPEAYFNDLFGRCRFADPFYQLMYFNLSVSLPDDMLAKVDRMSMAHSLETRVPFLDHRIVELTYAAGKSVKLDGYHLKSILRKTIGRELPSAILDGPKKAFSVPLRDWFRRDDLAAQLTALRNTDFGLDSDGIGKIIDANSSGSHDYGDFIWRLCVLKEWMRG